MIPDTGWEEERNRDPAAFDKRIDAEYALGRFGTPEEVAAWVAWRTPDRLTVCGSERFSFEFSKDYYYRFGAD